MEKDRWHEKWARPQPEGARDPHDMTEDSVDMVEKVQQAQIQQAKDTDMLGKPFARHYGVLSVIGRGGMGIVYKARHEQAGRLVAIKLLNLDRMMNEKSIARFQREAKAACRLDHPNIVRAYEYGVEAESGRPYLVMDYVEARPLSLHIKDSPLPIAEAIPIALRVAEALQHAHDSGVVHRDLKPNNILISDTSKAQGVQVADFGCAKVNFASRFEANSLTDTGEVFGSPMYMSPEQCMGKSTDLRTDIYSLGCVLYEMITGEPPRVGDSPMSTMLLHVQDSPIRLDPKLIPPAIEAVILIAMAHDPQDRYKSMNDFIADLKHAEQIAQRRDPVAVTQARLKQMGARTTVRYVLATMVILLILTIVGMFWVHPVPRPLPAQVPALKAPSERGP